LASGGNDQSGKVLFHRATDTVRIEVICRSFNHFSRKHASHFVPLPYQPENNDIPVRTPPPGFDALRTSARLIHIASAVSYSDVNAKADVRIVTPTMKIYWDLSLPVAEIC
jgi:hypothetical protein